jgi:terminal uridylyltransferase
MQAAQSGQLTNNRQSVGELLRGFFQYYASLSSYNNYGPRPPQFYWTNEVLSLRTPGGIRSKQDKGWVSAKTTITAEKKVTNRYLFAIEDPFELDHNVARTVTHRGIVAIRDEFRRAWRILGAIGKGMEPQEGGIFDEVIEGAPQTKESADEMWKEIVSPRPTEDGVQAATTESATTGPIVAV